MKTTYYIPQYSRIVLKDGDVSRDKYVIHAQVAYVKEKFDEFKRNFKLAIGSKKVFHNYKTITI